MQKFETLAKTFDLSIPHIDYREFELDNGLRVVLSKTDRIPSVAVNSTYHTGSKDEDENLTGLAHLFEHLMFEGTANTKRGEFDEMLTLRGGESNAYTSNNITSYFLVVPIHQLEFGLWLDSDRMAGFGIDKKSLEIQKKVVTEEKLYTCDNTPYGSMEEETAKRLFSKSGYRWPVIGDMGHIKKVSIKDIKEFYDKYYSPNNAVLSVAGNIDYALTEDLVRKYYGGLEPSKGIIRKIYNEPEIENEIRAEIYDNVNLAGKFFFWRGPRPGTKDYYALALLDNILSEGDSSRLSKILEHELELVSDTESFIQGMEEVSIFCVNAIALTGKDVEVVEKRMEEIIDGVKANGITDDELQKAKNKVETNSSFKRHSIINIADKLCSLKTFFGSVEKINSETFDYLSVTKEDILKAANKYLQKNKRVTLTYLPKK